MANYEVIGPVAVVRGEDKSERYIYRGGVFSDAGADDANIKHLVEVKLIRKVETAGGEVTIPDGDPTKTWTVPQLEKFASEKGIDLSVAKGKDEKLAAVIDAVEKSKAAAGAAA